MKAIWQGHVIAQSERTIVLGGHHYFPCECVDQAYLGDSPQRGQHPVAGELCYYHLQSPDGPQEQNAAWLVVAPQGEMAILADHIGFELCVDVIS
ncbi:DUF427 domain-containing protein [Alcanivorax sp. JB21]|uniref:DUF427 domain-containing protein n=1 Tax=Alcanivorax limicola TaxID=2874102 RepID=UPI001CC0F1A2|nr:DUF427 domain-containing protein [Alcanivorax limicola]MBZ2188532.1 DUF427 domain-containing protein [Alcanivorax limicola]